MPAINSAVTPAMQLLMTLSLLQAQLCKKTDQHLSVHGISFTEFMVLFQLDGAPAKTMRRIDLAESIGLSASGVTRLLMPMEKINLVQREVNPRDARVSLVKLSKTGQKIFNDALVTFAHSASTLTQALEDKKLGQLHDLANALL